MSVYAEVETLDDLRAARANASLQAQDIIVGLFRYLTR